MSRSFGKIVSLVGAVVFVGAGLVFLAQSPAVSPSVLAAAAGQNEQAQNHYLNNCAICHGQDGRGKTLKGRKLKVKDVHKTIKKYTEAQMIEIVTKGKGPNMDGFSKQFNAAQIKAIVEYYRSLASK